MEDFAHLDAVLCALRAVRVRRPGDEKKYLQPLIADALTAAGIDHGSEVAVGRGRVDFLTAAGVAIEVKRGRPPVAQLLGQLHRYAESPDVSALIVVLERSVQLPEIICGKPVRVLSLNALWGPAV